MTDHAAALEPVVLRRWTVTSGSNVQSRAAVVLGRGDRGWEASAEGRGTVDALFRAVDAALAELLDGHPRLLAYDVHALEEGPSAEGRVSVTIAPPSGAEGDRAAGRYSAEATSANIVAASLEAYVEALNAMLADPSWAGVAAGATSQGGLPPADPGAASAEFDEAATTIDTTEWFNR